MQKERLLIADADIDVGQSIYEFLKDDYDICFTSDGQQIYSLVEQKNIQLVITDIELPNIYIYQLLNQIKEYHPEIPIIIMYVYCDYTQEMEDYIRQMADAIFLKPFDLQELKKRIDLLLKINKISKNP